MKEKLTKLIAEAKREHTRYCSERMRASMDEREPYVTEASFIADKLIEAGVCFRLVVPRKGTRNDV